MTTEPAAPKPTDAERLVHQERARALARHLHDLAESKSAGRGDFERFVREHDDALLIKPA